MDSKRIDIGVGIGLCVFSLAVYLSAAQYAGRGVNSYGPEFFPQALAALLFLASGALVIQALRGHALKDLEPLDRRGLINATVTLGIAIAYLLLMNVLGFYLATGVFLYVMMWFLGQKKLWVRILTSVLVASFVYGLFAYFLKIPLPEGLFQSDL